MVAKTRGRDAGSRAPAAGAHGEAHLPRPRARRAWRARASVDAPIGRHPTQRTRMAVVAGGKPAVTHYRVRERFARAHAARVRPRDGPHAPDPRAPRLHRPPPRGRSGLRRARRAAICARQALHAWKLAFVHPGHRARRCSSRRRPRPISRRSSTRCGRMRLPAGWIVPDWPAPARVRAFVTTRDGRRERGRVRLAQPRRRASGDDPGARRAQPPHRARAPARRLRAGSRRSTARRWRTWTTARRGRRRRHRRCRGRRRDGRGASPSSSPPTACRCSCASRTARAWPSRTRDGAGSPRACSRTPWPRSAGEASRVLAWLGPAIGPAAFEVGPEVREAFVARRRGAAAAFAPHRERQVHGRPLRARAAAPRAGGRGRASRAAASAPSPSASASSPTGARRRAGGWAPSSGSTAGVDRGRGTSRQLRRLEERAGR